MESEARIDPPVIYLHPLAYLLGLEGAYRGMPLGIISHFQLG